MILTFFENHRRGAEIATLRGVLFQWVVPSFFRKGIAIAYQSAVFLNSKDDLVKTLVKNLDANGYNIVAKNSCKLKTGYERVGLSLWVLSSATLKKIPIDRSGNLLSNCMGLRCLSFPIKDLCQPRPCYHPCLSHSSLTSNPLRSLASDFHR